MSIVAAVKKAIGYGSDYWRLELPEPEQSAAYMATALEGREAWIDAYRMQCAEKYVAHRRFYQVET